VLEDGRVRAVGLFSGIGGLELGLERAGISTDLLCEYWEPAALTLSRYFEAPVVGDIRELRSIPQVDVVTAGFPCTDLSQVGRTAGIAGDESGLVRDVFRLIEGQPPTWVVLENVPNMLTLHGGSPIRHITEWLDARGWNWAYRTVDSQYFGVRQRRRRVFLVASQTEDPRGVLMADEHSPRSRSTHAAYGFYWTEGNRGLGWGPGVTPTLKGGSKLGIASPPGVWLPGAGVGEAIVRPSIEAGEKLQGFDPGWTDTAGRDGVRWKLVGNAVTVPVAQWIGARLVFPSELVGVDRRPLVKGGRWPAAASSVGRDREAWGLSESPIDVRGRTVSLAALLRVQGADALSHKATAGFTQRLKRSTLRHPVAFMQDLEAHLAATA
jgi:DNA (cytosine-5)-methyltransferase 1